MQSIPKIKKVELHKCFDQVVNLFGSQSADLVQAVVNATAGSATPMVYSPTRAVENQVQEIRRKVGVIADREGQFLFIRWVEELVEIRSIGASSHISEADLQTAATINLDDGSRIEYASSKIWTWVWDVDVDDNPDSIRLDVRCRTFPRQNIVPHYVLSNVQQAIASFKAKGNGPAMSLLSISLESTLRDALVEKGYTYLPPNIPTQDSFKKLKINVEPDVDGYKVRFNGPMPKSHVDFLSETDDPSSLELKIKRAVWNGDDILQISNASDLIDYWSSDHVAVAGQTKIGGLGAALDIARNREGIIDNSMFPTDLEKPILAIRNNLIHLSGEAMDREVFRTSSISLTLRQYIDDNEKVADALSYITELITELYSRNASRPL
jgi:hypothetical protein